MNKIGTSIFIFEIPLISLIVLQIWSKPFPLAVYIISIVLLGILIAVGIFTQHQRKAFVFVQMLILGLLIRNIYFLSTHFSVIPFGDAYNDFKLTRTIIDTGLWSHVMPGSPEYSYNLSMYSGWPGIDFIGAFLSNITQIDIYYISIWLPQIFFIASFIICYSFLNKLENHLQLNSLVTNIALCIISVSPFLFQPPVYYHQDIAVLYLFAVFLFIYKQIISRSFTNYVILFILFGGLIITHHYTSFVALMMLLLLSIFSLLGNNFSKRWPNGIFRDFNLPTFFSLSLILALGIFLWWSDFSVTIILGQQITGRLSNFVKMLSNFMFTPAIPDGNATTPPVLQSIWAPILLISRDILTYIAVILGFFLLWKKFRIVPAKYFLIILLIITGIFLSIDLLFGLGVGITYRGLFLFIPFIALSVGIFYQYISSHWHHFVKIPVGCILVFFVSASFLGLWAHTYFPLHLYDPSVSAAEAGEHPTSWAKMKYLFNNFVVYDKIKSIETDEPAAIAAIIPVNQNSKLQTVDSKGDKFAPGTLLVSFRDFDPFSYIPHNPTFNVNFDYDQIIFEAETQRQCMLIANCGDFKIWLKQN